MAAKFDQISKSLKEHYENTFDLHGPTSAGVDWGEDQAQAHLRYQNMLAVIPGDDASGEVSLLDVGCGYGGLLIHARNKGMNLQYTGIDLASNMIAWGKENLNECEFLEGDILEHDFSSRTFDYVVCNGILTQKLKSSLLDMDEFSRALIKKMFSLCKKGIAFNIMTSYVNFFADNLYYKHPCEILAFCFAEVTRNLKLDHSYGLYEYTLYLYR